MKDAIIGTGYVGLTTAVVLAYLNHDVAAVDKDNNNTHVNTIHLRRI